MDMPAPSPNSVQALSDDMLELIRAQRALNLSPPVLDNASPTMELSEMDFTSTEAITGAELQCRREQAALQGTPEQDDDMDIETSEFNHNPYMNHPNSTEYEDTENSISRKWNLPLKDLFHNRENIMLVLISRFHYTIY